MRASGIADQANPLCVEVILTRLCAHELNSGLGVIDRSRKNPGFSQPIIDGEKRVAIAGEEQTPIAINRARANLPAAAMNGDQDWRFRAAFGEIEIAYELNPIMLGKNQVGMVRNFVFRRGRLPGR